MNLSSINLRFFANIAPLVAGLNKAERALDQAGRQMQATGKKLSLQLTAPIAGLGAVAVSSFMAFEKQMAEVKAISGATGAEFEALKKNAEKLGSSTVFTAKEVGALQAEYARLGFTSKEITQVTEATLYLAQATGSDLARSAEIAGSTLRGFGLDASQATHVTDVMAESFNKSALDLSTFADSMKYVAPVAASAGVSLEQTTAMLAVLSNAGIKGSMAGTALRKIIGELGTGSEPVTEKLKKLAAAGITITDANEEVGLTAQSALMTLVKYASQIDPLTTSFENAAGAAKETAGIMDQTADKSVQNLTGAFEGLMISVGEIIIVALVPLMDTITSVLQTLNEMPAPIKVLSVVLAGLAAAIGPLLFTFGLMQRNFVLMLPYITKVGAALKFVATQGLRMLIGPIGLVVAALAALGAIAIYVGYNFDAFKAMALNAVRGFVNLSIGYLNNWIKVFNAIADTLGMDGIKIELFKKLEMEAVPKLKSISQVAKEVKQDVGKMFGGMGEQSVAAQAESVADASDMAAVAITGTGAAAKMTKEEIEALRKKYEGFNQMLENQFSLMQQYLRETHREVEDQLRKDIQFLPEMEPVEMDDLVEPDVFTELPKKFTNLSLAAQDFSKSLTDAINQAAVSFVVGIGEIIGAAAVGQAGIADFGTFALQSLAGLLKQVGELAIQTGVALLGIQVALSGIPGGALIAIAAGTALVALASGIQSSLAKKAGAVGGAGIPALAEGGIATGPTLALIGEGRGPEAVIPLDKLEGMMGGFGGQNVVVTGRLQGADLLISNERASRERSRYRGF